MATTAAQVKTAYKAINRVDLNDAVAQATADAINNGVTTLDAYINTQLAATVSTTQAAVAISAFVTGKTPTSAKLDELKVAADAQVASYTKMGVGNPALGAYEAFGKGFAETAEFKAKYSALSTTDFINSVYSEVFGKVPTAGAAANLNSQIVYFTNLYTKAGLANAADLAKGAVLGQIVGYAFVSSASADAQIDNQVAASLTNAANGDATAYGAPLPAGSNPNPSFSLTIGEDKLTGSAQDDVFSAPVLQNNAGALVSTLESIDNLNGGNGRDTLNATIQNAAAPVLTSIEIVNARFTAAVALDLTNATGVDTVGVANSTAAGAVNGLGAVANLSVRNQVSDVAFDKSTATTLALNLDTVGNATTTSKIDLGAVAAAKATTLNLTVNNTTAEVRSTAAGGAITTLSIAATGANTLTMTEGAKATTVSVTGAGSVDLTKAAFTGALTKFDGSTNTGGIKVDIQSTKAVAVSTGAGADTVDMDTAVAVGSSVILGAGNDKLYVGAKLASFDKGANGGDGIDIINITDGGTLDATTSKYISNFETLDVSGGKGNYDVSLNNFATVQLDEAINGALAANVDFKNTADTFTLNIASAAKGGDFDVLNNTTVTLKDAAGTTAKGDAETFTLSATINDGDKDGTAEGINAQTITVAGVEHIVVNSTVASTDGSTPDTSAAAHLLTAKLVAAAAETIVLTGNGGVDLSSVNTIGVVNKVDASASTGNVKIDFSTHATSVSYTGSAGVDTYSAGTKGDIIYTGKGADVVTLDGKAGAAGAVRDTFVLKTATDSQITDSSKDGKITIALDTGFDQLIKFDAAGDPAPVANTSDRLDLTNFGFAGSQRGVADVSAIVLATTDLTNIVDLFNTPAGDRGVAFTHIGADSYVLIDANKDGNFTAADDLLVKLTGVAALSETAINF